MAAVREMCGVGGDGINTEDSKEAGEEEEHGRETAVMSAWRRQDGISDCLQHL